MWHSSNLHCCSCQMEAAGKNSYFSRIFFFFSWQAMVRLNYASVRLVFVTSFKKCITMSIVIKEVLTVLDYILGCVAFVRTGWLNQLSVPDFPCMQY